MNTPETKPIDRNHAPAGYHAEALTDCCQGCAFVERYHCGSDKPCTPNERKDGRQVIFIKNEQP